ncbi:type I-B CRISPR-associated protein Cas8b/Csh1 [Paenibacillus tyrfis]|uniref:type I-B CRISPR-associated protein Cas8b/Csh1 n=1 Tax=Paenibacillus tyrfis TaxID=1501230 RepID=UPI000B5921E1|nr:type I-B CRISPR-associated protein Cas8b/Csh1 [Paenibacillus tyrfis]
MIDAIASLGKLQYSEDPQQLIRSLVRFRRPDSSKGQAHYLILDFSTKSKKCTIQLPEFNATREDSDYTPQRLHYIGIVPAAGLQYHTTGHDLRHLCSQVLPAVLDKLPGNSPLGDSIRQVLADYFVLDMELDPKNRYRYLLDLEAVGIVNAGFTNKIRSEAADKERPGLVAKELLDWVKRERQIAPEQIDLFAFSIDGQLIARHPDYIRAVLDDQVSMFDKAQEGICCVTGQQAEVSADLTKFKFKYYITDKLNFSSSLTGRFERNFQLSRTGVWQLLLGERYIMNRLRLRIGSFNVYMIPEFLDSAAYDVAEIRETINEVYSDVRALATQKEARKIEEGLKKELGAIESLDGIRTQMLINLLFFEENKSEFKVYRHVKDISPSRITLMLDKGEEVREYFQGIAEHFRANRPSLESLYYMIPLQVDGKGKVKNPQMLMQLYDSILSGRKLERRELIEAFVALLGRVYHGTTGGLQIGNKRGLSNEQGSDFAWIRLIWEQMHYIRWLEEIGNLKREGAGGMAIELLSGLEKEQEHIQASGFDEARAAMFLLGGAIKFVADAQQPKLKSKPIMQKVNFKGISEHLLQRLIAEVFEKAEYYRKAYEYFPRYRFDAFYSELTRLLDLSGFSITRHWKLNEQETLHYILSGYTFQVGISMKPREYNGGQAADGQPDENRAADADHILDEEEHDDEQ